MRLNSATAAVMAILAAAPACATQLPDLTGEWHGTELCDELDSGAPGVFIETSPIFIVQAKGGRFRMLFRLANGKADVIYDGILKAVAGSASAEGVAVACGGAFQSQEVIRLRPIGVANGQPFFNGESVFFTNDFPGSGGAVNFGTCKYVYQRVTSVRRNIPRCDPSPIGPD